MSQDTDLVEPLNIVKNELKKTVGLVCLDGKQPSFHLKNVASFVRHLSQADLAASQFPAQIVKPNGDTILKPANW